MEKTQKDSQCLGGYSQRHENYKVNIHIENKNVDLVCIHALVYFLIESLCRRDFIKDLIDNPKHIDGSLMLMLMELYGIAVAEVEMYKKYIIKEAGSNELSILWKGAKKSGS